jgi:hypothetical protein
MGPFSHNPHAHIAPDGTFLVFHIGGGHTSPSRPEITTCNNGSTPSLSLAYPAPASSTSDFYAPSIIFSKNADGPFESLNNSGTGDSCNNPGAYIFPNGTTLLVCKMEVKPPAGEGIRQMQMAVAPHWKGPYKKLPPTQVFGEDANIFRQPQDGNFHMLLHSMHPHKLPTTAWSPDGISWTPVLIATTLAACASLAVACASAVSTDLSRN